MADCEKLLTKETVYRSRLEKLIENGKKTATVKRTQGFFESKITDLKQLWNEYSEVDLAINHALKQKSADDLKTFLEEDRYGKTEYKYAEYLADLTEGLRKFIVQPPQTVFDAPLNQTTTIIQHESSLPKITIPKYDGNYDLWKSFHDLFVSLIHTNTKLSPVQKLHHLKSCLTGDAEKLLRHFPITNDDYEPAWEKLKTRYENKRIIVNHQLKTLVNQPKLTIEKPKGLKMLIDTTDECLQQLKSLGVDTKSWDVLLVYLLVQKLPYVTLRSWEEEQGVSTELPDYDTFNEFLNTRLKILESIADAINTNSSNKPMSKDSTLTHHSTTNNRCPACNGNHFAPKCEKYRKMNATERLTAVKKAGRCVNCLSNSHSVIDCESKYKCFKCDQRHHTTLHDNTKASIVLTNLKPNESQSTETSSNKSEKIKKHQHKKKQNKESQISDIEEQEDAHVYMSRNQNLALLSTALVVVQSDRGDPTIIRCLIDSGSQTSLITEEASKLINATRIQTATNITGINTSSAAVASQKTKLKLRSCGHNTTILEEEFLIIKTITDSLPTKKMSKKDYNHLRGLTLADPTFWKPGKIDALLGVGLYAKIVQEGIRRGSETAPVALNTIFGWILLGSTSNEGNKNVSTFTVTTQDTDLDHQLRQFWECEELPPKKIFTKQEEICQELYNTTVERLTNGRYQVQLPFKNIQPPILGNSRPQAFKRFCHLQRQLATKPDVQQQYSKCINEYLELGHMQPVNYPNNEEQHYYLPHHAVFKDSSTTKLRVVFDASAKTTDGSSLNDHLLKGPTLQSTLFAILLNWRKYKVAMNADIEKMYRMIEVHPMHRKYQRIIWQHPKTGKLQDYELNTVTFGTASAPYLAIRTLQQLADDEKERWPLASQIVKEEFYVDDVLTGAHNIKDAKILQSQLIDLLKSGGFNLRKWTSNELQLIEHLPIEYKESKSDLIFNTNESIKTLGIRWHPVSDYFSFSIKSFKHKSTYTKRTILSEVASLYDPLGWLAPIIITAKILMQSLWIIGSSWDNPVSDQIQDQWTKFQNDLIHVQQVKIPRWVLYSPQAHIQLHGFCDASEKAYAAAVYMRVVTCQGHISSQLLTAKTRVAPTKPITIPRLELNGAVLLARLMKTTIEDMRLKDISMHAWTDSTIVLQWIKEHPSKWKTYVANRVVEIQEIIKFENWRHVPTNSNPADLASRGVTPLQLINQSLWWNGPDWLIKNEASWPKIFKINEPTNYEMKAPKPKTLLVIHDNNILYKYSSYTRLIRIIALIKRFIYNCRNPSQPFTKTLSVTELDAAEIIILQSVQKTVFSDDNNCIRNNKSLPRNSKLVKLNPFIDKNGLLRVGGRLENAVMSYNRKHPIILPQKHHVTKILIDKLHKETLHGGNSLVLNASREKYWILDARRSITSRIHNCVTCSRQRGTLNTQLMGNLPSMRVNVTKPFSKVGIDYAGPVMIKSSTLRNAKSQKAYFCIFVCMATKAIHLEMASDLSSAAFIAALKRFVSRRGLCTDIYSDCGTNFIGGRTILQQELNQVFKKQQSELISHLTTKGINWHFNPPASPHFGGLWEAGVKSVKYHLRRVLGNKVCTFEEYATILSQIEACLNSRPLCYINNNPEELFVLTPGHFLIGEAITAIPEPTYEINKIVPSQRWKLLQATTQQFWKRWSKDYLNQLQNRPKWTKIQSNLKIGEVVIIKNENTHPTVWPMGIIEKLFPGKDGLVRVVQLRTKHGTFQRPISKICRLPLDEDN